MKRENERAAKLEKEKEREKWEQAIQYQEQLEKQLEEQVGAYFAISKKNPNQKQKMSVQRRHEIIMCTCHNIILPVCDVPDAQ